MIRGNCTQVVCSITRASPSPRPLPVGDGLGGGLKPIRIRTTVSEHHHPKQEVPKVSVIIPVYNTAAYVRQAIESVCRQTLKELEIIVVNDGSTDGSAALLHELARTDGRIRLYEQENQGLSAVRNVGMARATGRYLYFMDSDDLLEADALELCYAKCEAEELDFVFFDAENFYDNDDNGVQPFFDYQRTKSLQEGVCTGLKMLNTQIEQFQFTPSVCLNLIRRDYLCECSLAFCPNILHEDQLFTTLLYLQARRVNFISRTFFHRRVRQGSIMTSRFGWRNMESYLTVARKLLQYPPNEPPGAARTIHLLLSQMLDAVMWQAHVMPLRDRLRALHQFYRYGLLRFVRKRTLAVLLLKKRSLSPAPAS